MYLLYVDESGDTGPKGSTHLLLVGAALFEGKWRWLRGDLEALLTRYFPSPADRPRELHAAEARKGRGAYSKITPVDRANLLSDACEILDGLAQKELTLFSIVVDKTWWFQRNPGKSGDDLYLAAFEDLVSRFDYYLKRRHAVHRFHSVGTQWARLENVIESVLFLESHESPGVQFADLGSYAIWRVVEAADTSLAQKLKYCFDREPDGPKWHGIRFHGPQVSPARTALRSVWPGT